MGAGLWRGPYFYLKGRDGAALALEGWDALRGRHWLYAYGVTEGRNRDLSKDCDRNTLPKLVEDDFEVTKELGCWRYDIDNYFLA